MTSAPDRLPSPAPHNPLAVPTTAELVVHLENAATIDEGNKKVKIEIEKDAIVDWKNDVAATTKIEQSVSFQESPSFEGRIQLESHQTKQRKKNDKTCKNDSEDEEDGDNCDEKKSDQDIDDDDENDHNTNNKNNDHPSPPPMIQHILSTPGGSRRTVFLKNHQQPSTSLQTFQCDDDYVEGVRLLMREQDADLLESIHFTAKNEEESDLPAAPPLMDAPPFSSGDIADNSSLYKNNNNSIHCKTPLSSPIANAKSPRIIHHHHRHQQQHRSTYPPILPAIDFDANSSEATTKTIGGALTINTHFNQQPDDEHDKSHPHEPSLSSSPPATTTTTTPGNRRPALSGEIWQSQDASFYLSSAFASATPVPPAAAISSVSAPPSLKDFFPSSLDSTTALSFQSTSPALLLPRPAGAGEPIVGSEDGRLVCETNSAITADAAAVTLADTVANCQQQQQQPSALHHFIQLSRQSSIAAAAAVEDIETQHRRASEVYQFAEVVGDLPFEQQDELRIMDDEFERDDDDDDDDDAKEIHFKRVVGAGETSAAAAATITATTTTTTTTSQQKNHRDDVTMSTTTTTTTTTSSSHTVLIDDNHNVIDFGSLSPPQQHSQASHSISNIINKNDNKNDNSHDQHQQEISSTVLDFQNSLNLSSRAPVDISETNTSAVSRGPVDASSICTTDMTAMTHQEQQQQQQQQQHTFRVFKKKSRPQWPFYLNSNPLATAAVCKCDGFFYNKLPEHHHFFNGAVKPSQPQQQQQQQPESFVYKGIHSNPPDIVSSGSTRGNYALLHRKAWLEVSDKYHRYGKNLRLYYRFWERLGYPNRMFFDWLDSKGEAAGQPLPELEECPRAQLDSDTVLYITNPAVSAGYALQFMILDDSSSSTSNSNNTDPATMLATTDTATNSKAAVAGYCGGVVGAAGCGAVVEQIVTTTAPGRAKVLDVDGDPVQTGPDGWIFILRDNVMYGAPKVTTVAGLSKQRFHHSSFFGGKAVAAAGIIITDDSGILTHLYPHSGHYRPGEAHMQRVLFFLHNEGVDLRTFEMDTQQIWHVTREGGGKENNKEKKKKKKKKDDYSDGGNSETINSKIDEGNNAPGAGCVTVVSAAAAVEQQQPQQKKKKVESLHLMPAVLVACYLAHKARFIGEGIFSQIHKIRKADVGTVSEALELIDDGGVW